VEAIQIDRTDLMNRHSIDPPRCVCVKFICKNKHRALHFQVRTEGKKVDPL